MRVKKFKDLEEKDLKEIINAHFNHWSKYSPKMRMEDTEYKFKKLYTTDEFPFGIALFDDLDNVVGFCVFKIKNLEKYPEIYPWVSDVMIFEKYRGKGYGRKLIEFAEKVLKEEGYKTVYIWTDQVPEFYKKLGYTYKQKVEKNEGGYGELFYKDI